MRKLLPLIFAFLFTPALLTADPHQDDNIPDQDHIFSEQVLIPAFHERKIHPEMKTDLVVNIPAGDYVFTKKVEFTDEYSGTPQSRTIFRGEGEVRFLGAKPVTGWTKVTDPAILKVLPEPVRGKIWQADLKALGITDFGSPKGGGAELFFDDQPMRLARYPNEGFVKIAELTESESKNVRGTKGSIYGKFFYSDDRISAWTGEKDPWVSGYWFWDWAEGKQQITKIDPETRYMELAEPYHSYGYRKGQWFYGFNLLCELDEPGEFYIDRAAGILYFFPPIRSDEELTQKEALLTVSETILDLKNLRNVTFENITFEGTRGVVISVSGCENVELKNLTLKNSGAAGVRISGSKNVRVVNCELYGLGGMGVFIGCGNRQTLEPGACAVENCFLHHNARIYRICHPAISLNGVGNVARNNLITDQPHMAIYFSGNDHLMEYNEIGNVCWESNDAGAVYAGRDWTMRGNVFRFNYLHDISGFENRGCVGVYLDDMFASCAIESNIFQRVTRAAMIGGGRDNSIVNNIFIDCKPAIHLDARALGWAHYHADGWLEEIETKGTVCGMKFTEPPYSTRYPELPAMLQGEPKAPEGNVIARNICVRGIFDEPTAEGKPSIEAKARPYLKRLEQNTVWTLSADPEKKGQMEGEDPLFVNPDAPEKTGFQLRPESPALKKGFQPIPFEKIGRK